jgi:hypothetical protein
VRWFQAWVAVVAVIACALVWTLRKNDAAPRHGQLDVAAARSPTTTHRTAADEAHRRRADAVVAERNAEQAEERRAFESDGWTFVDVAPPDPALTAASPDGLPARELELRMQLASAPPGIEHLSNVRAIAIGASDTATRIAAIEAIANMGPGEPQRALIDVLATLDTGDPARGTVVALLRPESTNDVLARDLTALLDASSITSIEKDQIAMSLAALALREGSALPAEMVGQMSSEALALVDRMTQLALAAPQPSRN